MNPKLPGRGSHFYVGPVGDVPTFRVSIFRKKSRPEVKISAKFQNRHLKSLERSNILRALLLVKNSDLMHTFDLIFPEQVCSFFQRFFQSRLKKIPNFLPVDMSTVTLPGQRSDMSLLRRVMCLLSDFQEQKRFEDAQELVGRRKYARKTNV